MLKRNQFLILSIYLLTTILILYRGTCFLTQGTFDGDEVEFYKYAKDNGIINGLFFVYDQASYFKLWTNIANTFASLFSFDAAKIITNFFSVVIYYVIFTYILFFKSELFLTIKHKTFAICVVLFSPGMTPEVWMGSAHIREYFAILAFILIFYDSRNDNNFKKIISNILLILSFMSSIWATVLSPVFFIKYLLKRTRHNLIFFITSFICSLIQFFIVLNVHFLQSSGTASRFNNIGTEKIFSFIYNVPVRSFFGSTIPKLLFIKTDFYLFKFFNNAVFIISTLSAIFFIIYVFKKKDLLLNLILLSLILVSTFAMLGTLTPGFVGGRYAVVSCVILTFLVFRIFTIEKIFLIKYFFGILLSMSLLIGIVEFKYKSPLPERLQCKDFEIESKYK